MPNLVFLAGGKVTILDALKKLNEISVVTIALYVLLSFQGIPYSCSNDQFQRCYSDLYALTANNGENGAFFDHAFGGCGPARMACMNTLVATSPSNTWIPTVPVFQAQNPAYFQFCYCLIKAKSYQQIIFATSARDPSWTLAPTVAFSNLTQASVNLSSEPNRTCDVSILPVTLTVFFTALLMVIMGEILLPRMFSIIVLLICAAGFYAGTLGSLYVAATVCPGQQYVQTVDTVRNLIIACAGMLFLAILYDAFILYQRAHNRSCTAIIDYDDEDAGSKAIPMTTRP